MRRAARVDTNQADVIQWYEDLGWQVINTSGAGKGFVDLIAVKYVNGVWQTIFVEVKRSKYSQYTEAQKRFNAKYPGLAVRVETVEDVVRSIDDVGASVDNRCWLGGTNTERTF